MTETNADTTATPRWGLTNTGVAGVVYSAAGHSLGGGECILVDEIDEVARHAIDVGQLLAREHGHGASQPE